MVALLSLHLYTTLFNVKLICGRQKNGDALTLTSSYACLTSAGFGELILLVHIVSLQTFTSCKRRFISLSDALNVFCKFLKCACISGVALYTLRAVLSICRPHVPNELLLVLQTQFQDLKTTTTLAFPTTAEKLYCGSGRWKTARGLCGLLRGWQRSEN